jgi:N-acetyl-D-muramate 6-phosphate phosphatase
MTDAPAPRALEIDAVLFDLDGTLADTAPDLAAALNAVRATRGMPPMPLAELRPWASHGARGLLGAGMGVAPDAADYAQLRDAFLDFYAMALCVGTTLFSAVDVVLSEIESRGMRWGIVTNKATRFTLPLLDALGLAARAHAVVCGDTTAHAKPHPEPLLAAARYLATPASRCVYVGDAERDVTAGIAAGMHTIVARYGYITADEVPGAWPADGFIQSPRDLIDWLPRS